MRSKKENLNITIEFIIFELVQMKNFILNRSFWFFGPIFFPEMYFLSKKRERKLAHQIQYIKISLGTHFQLKKAYWLFGPHLSKKDITCPNQDNCASTSNSAYFNWSSFNQAYFNQSSISQLVIKYHHKQTILIFQTNLAQNEYF